MRFHLARKSNFLATGNECFRQKNDKTKEQKIKRGRHYTKSNKTKKFFREKCENPRQTDLSSHFFVELKYKN